MRIILARSSLAILNILVFLVEEGWIIAMVLIFPFWLALVLVTTLLSSFAIISSYLCGLGKLPPIFERWIKNQKIRAKERLVKVARGAAWTSTLSTAIVVSPTTSAVMLHLMGLNKLKAYLMDISLSLISGLIWCGIYGGGIAILRAIF